MCAFLLQHPVASVLSTTPECSRVALHNRNCNTGEMTTPPWDLQPGKNYAPSGATQGNTGSILLNKRAKDVGTEIYFVLLIQLIYYFVKKNHMSNNKLKMMVLLAADLQNTQTPHKNIDRAVANWYQTAKES